MCWKRRTRGKPAILLIATAAALVLGLARVSEAVPVGTAFTYQGRLIDADEAADGLYDFQFKLYDANTDGNQVGSDVNKPDVDVIDGYFTVEVDFGSNPFGKGDARWLEIGVRPGEMNDPNVYTKLSPRQQVAPAPYALQTSGIFLDGTNTLVGLEAGETNAGASNTFVGKEAGYSNTTGNYNTFSGHLAGYSNTTGNSNTFSGRRAGYSNTIGSYNIFSGSSAGYSNTTGYSNTFSGYWAGRFNTTGYSNTFSGYWAGFLNTIGNYNTFLGDSTGYSNTTGNYNTFSGEAAGFLNSTGHHNTFLGSSAGFYTTGSGNVFIGYQAGYNETGSDKLYIANSDADPPLIYGEFDTGNVGIQVTDPSEDLDVSGTARLRGISSGAGLPVVADGNGKLWKAGPLTYYEVTATSATEQTVTTGVHNFCALTRVHLQTGDAGTNKWCQVVPNGDGTWTLKARGGSSTTVTAGCQCF